MISSHKCVFLKVNDPNGFMFLKFQLDVLRVFGGSKSGFFMEIYFEKADVNEKLHGDGTIQELSGMYRKRKKREQKQFLQVC